MIAYRRWHANRYRALNFKIISYEQMHRDAGQVLRVTLQSIGTPKVDDALLNECVAFCTFERMRAYEENEMFASPRMQSTVSDLRARKIRQGKMGVSAGFFSKPDMAYMESRIQDGNDPFASYYEDVDRPQTIAE